MSLVTWMGDENWARSLAVWNLFFFFNNLYFSANMLYFSFLFFFFGLCDMWILSSLNKDRTHAEVKTQTLNHWIIREVPVWNLDSVIPALLPQRNKAASINNSPHLQENIMLNLIIYSPSFLKPSQNNMKKKKTQRNTDNQKKKEKAENKGSGNILGKRKKANEVTSLTLTQSFTTEPQKCSGHEMTR